MYFRAAVAITENYLHSLSNCFPLTIHDAQMSNRDRPAIPVQGPYEEVCNRSVVNLFKGCITF